MSMRALVVALALMFGMSNASAESDLVKLRAAKPTAKKASATRAKKKPQPSTRKAVAKSKPKKKKQKVEAEEVRLRPMP